MDKYDVLEFLKSNEYPSGRVLKAKKYKTITDVVKEETMFLDEIYTNVELSTRLFCVVNEITSVPKCINPSCVNYVNQNRRKEEDRPYPGFTRTCSRECSGKDVEKFKKIAETLNSDPTIKERADKKRRKTNVEKYGVEIPSKSVEVRKKMSESFSNKTEEERVRIIESRSNTYRNRTGFDNPFLNPEVRDRIRSTTIERYGVDNVTQSKEVRDKIRATNELRYGSGEYFGSDDWRDKTIKTNQERYGVDFFTQSADFSIKRKETMVGKYGREHTNQSHISMDMIRNLQDPVWCEQVYKECGEYASTMAELVGIDRTTATRILSKHGIVLNQEHNVSAGENELLTWVREVYDGEIQTNVPILDGKHIDIFIPEISIGIEYNGCYFHSEAKKPKDYHFDKTEIAKRKGINLLHIWSHIWERKKDIVKSMIMSKLGISDRNRVYARNTVVVEVSGTDAKDFHEKYHIQGHGRGGIHLGIFSDGVIIGCLTLLERGANSGDFEIIRYSTSVDIIGGFSKALKAFQNVCDWNRISTFADRDISDGDLYRKTGFEEIHITRPIMSYFDPNSGNVYHRSRFMKSRLDGDVVIYDDSLTEREMMGVSGYLRLYNSGLIKFAMTR